MSATAESASLEPLASRAMDLLGTLISFNSVSSESNLPLLKFVRSYLLHHQVECETVPSPDGKKANLLARIGPATEGGIVLSGHTDVVPVTGQTWDTDPFTLTERHGKLYGRGTADMKSFLAICLAFVPEIAKLPLNRPVWFAFSYDEEIGCLGVPHLLEYMEKHIPMPSFALIGEPTGMNVVTAHKGVFSYETIVHGKEWHSSQPHYGANAVHAACDLVQFLSGLAAELASVGMRDERFDPPYSTVHVGVIRGGTARNIIPRECCFNWEIRPLPGEDGDAIHARFEKRAAEALTNLRKNFPEAEIITRPISRMLGVTLPAEAVAARQLVMRCAGTNREHAVSFGTEAGVFHDYGIPAIICGPGRIEQAHQPNEWVEISQIHACVGFMQRLLGELE